MRVLIVHGAYQQFGGEDSVVRAERELLERHGDEVLLYSRHNDETKNFNLADKAFFFPQTVYSWKSSAEIADVVHGFQPDVAFVHNVYPLISPSVYYKLNSLGVPAVQVLHNFRPFCPNGLYYTQGQICEDCKGGNYLSAVRKRCFRDSYLLSGLYGLTLGSNRLAGMVDNIAGFICLTEFFKIKMQEAGVPDSKLFVRPNFVYAPSLQSPSLQSPSLQSKTNGAGNYALYLGRLSPEKGCWTLIHAFEQMPQLTLKIIGTGPQEQELKDYVRSQGLNNIQFLGFKSGAEKWQLLGDAVCLVLPSEWYENFPVTVLEGYMAAKPVVASRMGGLPYIVDDGKTGLLFEAGNVNELAQKIQQLADDPAAAASMGARGRTLSETKYGPEQGYSNLMNIFSQVQATA